MTTFIITCILIELTPGPNMVYLTILSLAAGRRAGFFTVAGIALGLALVASVAAFGMARLIADYPLLYEVIRWAGVGYLLYLAFSSWKQSEEISPARADGSRYHKRYFLRGFLVNVLNPKAAVFYLTVLPGFLQPDVPIIFQTFILILISIAIATTVHLAIVLFASYMHPFIGQMNQQRLIRRLFAVLLAVVAGWFALST